VVFMNSSFTSQQPATHCDFVGVPATQSVIFQIERWIKASFSALGGQTISPAAEG
jgi:hypothetical protein